MDPTKHFFDLPRIKAQKSTKFNFQSPKNVLNHSKKDNDIRHTGTNFIF